MKRVEDLMQEDIEEYRYRQLLMSEYIKICLSLLKNSKDQSSKKHVYEAMQEILAKTHDLYGLSDVITSLETLPILMHE